MKKEKITVGMVVGHNDFGKIGTATTVAGALRVGRRWARAHSTKSGVGNGPIIVLVYQSGYCDSIHAW